VTLGLKEFRQIQLEITRLTPDLYSPPAVVWRRLGFAALFSLILHALVLGLLVAHQSLPAVGNLSCDDGAEPGNKPVYLSLTKGSQSAHDAMALEKPAHSTTETWTTSKSFASHSGTSEAPDDTLDSSPSAASVSPVYSRNLADYAPRYVSDSAAESAAAPGTGSPNGDQILLQEIAKCFPAGTTPSLPSVRLQIEVDGNGNLSTTPVTDIDLAKSSPDDIRAANAIIQATLLCGPYQLPPSAKGHASVLANFSSLFEKAQ